MKRRQKKLRRQKNSPVFRLSPDIIITIFFFLRDESLAMWNVRGCPRQGWKWVAVTKTCKLWRNLAIERSSLWTDVFTSSTPHTLRVFLERSKRLELNVHLDELHYCGNAYSVTALLKSHMWRARSLTGVTRGMCSFNVKTLMLELTERCKNIIIEYAPTREDPIFEEIGDLNPSLQLESLRLNGVPLPWSSSLFHGLTELSILDSYNPDRINPNISEFRNILEHCPNLRYLKLDRICPTMNVGDEIQEPNLPHLEHVEWNHLSFSAISYLFKILGVRDTVKVDATFDDYFVEFPEPLPEGVLQGRKRCDTICMDISSNKISLRSNPFHNGICMMSDTALSINVFEDPDDLPPFSKDMTTAISLLLQDPFWKTADEILVSFFGFEPRIAKSCMGSISWGILLDGLPRHTKMLSIEIPFKKYERKAPVRAGTVSVPKEGIYTIFNGFPEALSLVLEESGVRLPELENLTIIYEGLTEEEATHCREILLKQVEERTMHTGRMCSVDFRQSVPDEVGVVPLAFTLNRIH